MSGYSEEKYQLSFGHADFKMLTDHPSGNADQVVLHTIWDVGGVQD